ncbi:MAG TPA: type II toxin-antitoxin system RelE/ParE family toxin [Desulfobacteraceae bacterium]|nr:type II toxin-antitoxin system RelE/ParE family toxin [Desulfobacteraceae bacterium]
MRIRWTRKALVNLENAVNYIAADSPGNARKVAQKIRDSIYLLSGQPTMGRPGRVAGTRELVISGLPFIVSYAEYNGEIVILRIIHTSMKWPDEYPGQ